MRTLSHRNRNVFDRFYYGAAYYPEHWSDADRQADIALMKAARFNAVRMGEFAWDRLEPREGEFDFSFFNEQIAMLDRHGIKTFFCTPTAAPPRWLSKKHPEILRIDGEGRSMKHGSRQHACTTNELFREYSRRITSAVAENFRRNPGVIGFQTDNELHCHFSCCHCPACEAGFRQWLERKYRHIDALNLAWGTSFWAQTCDGFDDVEIPSEMRPAYANPGALLDFQRFSADAVADFQAEQIEILRAANPEWKIFHNGIMGVVDYRGRFGQELDITGFDSYPFFTENESDRPWRHAYSLDRVRSMGGSFIIPEHQSGPGGQPPYLHQTPEPGELRLMVYRSILHGAEALLYFRWRTCRFGAEEYWCGILDWNNIPGRRYEEVRQTGDELAALVPAVRDSRIRIDVAIAAGDNDANYAHSIYSLGLPAPEEAALSIYKEYFQHHYAVGLIHPSDDLSGVKLYFLPHWEIIDRAAAENLAAYVDNGGVLVIGCRSGSRDEFNRIVAEPFPGILAGLAGATVGEFGKLPSGREDPRRHSFCLNGVQVEGERFYETLVPRSAETVACWQTRFLKGAPAVTRRRTGQGLVYYVGTYLMDGVLAGLRPELDRAAGVEPLIAGAPAVLEISERRLSDGTRLKVMMNTSGEALEEYSLGPYGIRMEPVPNS
ncbi:MAG: beta-galactosidase [Lentisphaeria bacterium]|nr:beta-galactosidase [Lentisphaeria bacterium]